MSSGRIVRSLLRLALIDSFIQTHAQTDAAALNAQLEQMVRGWQPEVEAALAKRGDPGRAAALAARFAPAFPPNYRNLYNPEEAARDILRLRDLGPDAPLEGVDFRRFFSGSAPPSFFSSTSDSRTARRARSRCTNASGFPACWLADGLCSHRPARSLTRRMRMTVKWTDAAHKRQG